MKNNTRYRISLHGQVQGIGLRPAVYRSARKLSLSGWVSNTSGGVIAEIEGKNENINKFLENLDRAVFFPQNLVISKKKIREKNEGKFIIKPSLEKKKGEFTLIPPDICTCEDCRKELFSGHDRRFLYPFINCSVCGPRFTIIRDIPYDRAKTTMKKFRMCAQCLSEYKNPEDRRFHAEPNACPACGPGIFLMKGKNDETPFSGKEAVAAAVQLLKSGRIIAIKGIGGFHLACDAENDNAVRRLRNRKYREDKPFAVMAGNVDIIRKYCRLSREEEVLVSSRARPIVILEKLANKHSVSEAVAPGNTSLGFMLPYTPLHFMLFTGNSPKILVMTSGNISDEPISYKNEEAFDRLSGIADFFLVNNRDIHMRCDDSVARVLPGLNIPVTVRRSRGYAPLPVGMNFKFRRQLLACGAHLKNTFCLAKGEFAFMGQHIGDLENAETMAAFEKGIEHFKNMFSVKPEAAVCDLHPEYLSTKYAFRLKDEGKIKKILQVQHHHAHIAGCMAENNITERKVIGVSFDGLGLGDDGALWGGEFFICDRKSFKRAAHLKYTALPGGESAVKEPWRMGLVYLRDCLGSAYRGLRIDFLKSIDGEKQDGLLRLFESNLNVPLISSMGRLFDAVSAILNIRHVNNYEGQAAVELEQSAKRNNCFKMKPFDFELKNENGIIIIDPSQTIKSITAGLLDNAGKEAIAYRFHLTVAEMISRVCCKLRKNSGIKDVVMSGGVFQNTLLFKMAHESLTAQGYSVYFNCRVPANDGGLSLGQAVIADSLL